MTEIPKPEVTEKDTTRQNNLTWGFFSGLSLLEQRPIPPTDTTVVKEKILKELVDMSRGLPQIGVHDPAGIIESLMASSEARAAARSEASTQAPKAVQSDSLQPKRGIIRRIFGR